jgi:hypothetical protein
MAPTAETNASGMDNLRGAHTVPLRKEERADEWHFEADRHNSLVEHEQIKGKDFRQRETAAKERKKVAESEAERRIEELLRESEAFDAQCNEELRQMREQLHEANERAEDAKENCNQELLGLEQEITREREHANKVQGLLWDEKKNSREMAKRIDEIEEQKNEQLVIREGQIESIRVETQDEIIRLHRQAEQEVKSIERKMEQELLVLQQQVENSQKQCEGNVSVEVAKKKQVQGEAEDQVQVLNKGISKTLRETSEKVVQIAEDCESRVIEVQRRDFEKEDFLKEKIDVMLECFQRADAETNQAKQLEEHHKCRVRDTVNVLGTHFPPSTQYSPILDRKMKTALHVISGSD